MTTTMIFYQTDLINNIIITPERYYNNLNRPHNIRISYSVTTTVVPLFVVLYHTIFIFTRLLLPLSYITRPADYTYDSNG
jgi:hypothetical protein